MKRRVDDTMSARLAGQPCRGNLGFVEDRRVHDVQLLVRKYSVVRLPPTAVGMKSAFVFGLAKGERDRVIILVAGEKRPVCNPFSDLCRPFVVAQGIGSVSHANWS